MPAPSPAETATTELETVISPRLIGMAAVYGYEVNVDEDAVFEALPHLVLPGTEPGPLKLNANLLHRSSFKDAYWMQRTVSEDEVEGAEVTIYFTEKDVRKRRGNQDVVLPALKEAVNTRNRSLRREASRFNDHRATEMFMKLVAIVGVPTAAAIWGGQEISGASEDVQTLISSVGGLGALVTSSAGVIHYGPYYSQRTDLRRSPYQRIGDPIPEDLPPIVRFDLKNPPRDCLPDDSRE